MKSSSNKSRRTLEVLLFLGALSGPACQAFGQSRQGLQSEDFQGVLITSLYCTAFGAAAGAALLPFLPGSPMDNVRFVSGGASLGFLLGSAVGFYNVSQNQTATAYPGGDDPSGVGSGPYPSADGHTSITEDPRGSLIVGRGWNLGFAFPRVLIGERLFVLSLVDVRF